MTIKLAIYTRISTTDQTSDSQLHTLREYAKGRGFQLVEEFSDVGVSGSKDRRPQLDRLMDQARKRKFDAIMVFRFDRFARSSSHLARALDEFKNLGIQFISYSENIDTASPIGAAMFTIIGAMAQLERDIIRERVKAGLAAAKAKGKRLGPPKTIRIDKLIPLYKKGLSIRKIATELGCSASGVANIINNLDNK